MQYLVNMLRATLPTGLALLCLAFALAPAAAVAPPGNYAKVSPEAIYARNSDRFGHLKYFGFYNSAGQHWNGTEALAGFTNLAWIAHSNLNLITRRMREAGQAGAQVVLSLQPFLFNDDFTLRNDYLQRIAELQQRLLFEGLVDSIAMIYPVDEPLLHAASSKSTSRAQMLIDLELANRDIAELFPGIPRGVIFNHREIVRREFQVPASYNWIGFDCYASLWDCDGRQFTSLYSGLLEKMNAEQMLMAVPESWIRYRNYERRDLETSKAYDMRKKRMLRNLNKRLRQHYEIALSEPRFVAFIPFLWSMEAAEGQPRSAGFGVDQFLRRFPEGGQEYTDLLKQIGSEIISANHKYPNLKLSQTEASLWRPWNSYEGAILDVSDKGVVSAWSVNRAMPHKALRMQVVLRRDGKQIYDSHIKRSFVLDRSLQSQLAPTLPGLGVHGFRHTIPRGVLQELRGESVTLAVRIYGDRASGDDYLEVTSQLQL